MSAVMPQIDHVIVLMLENRSFDNLLGWLYDGDEPKNWVPRPHGSTPTYDGLNDGLHWNQFSANESQVSDFNDLTDADCSDDVPRGNRHYVVKGTGNLRTPNVDPFEPYLAVNQQLFWPEAKCPHYNSTAPATMLGFLANYRRHKEVISDEQALQILQTYIPSELPVLSVLARSYAVSDRWFSSVPSQTFCNRGFVGAGTSCGLTDNSLLHPFDAPTIWNIFEQAGISWRIYYQDGLLGHHCLTRHLFTPLHGLGLERFQHIKSFYSDVKSGNLPAYSFVEPSWNFTLDDIDFINGNSYHPPAHLEPGERFVRELFGAVSSSPKWEQTLLVITFDEHGGTYDHVAPPRTALAPWDGPGYTAPTVLEHGFDFCRFGVRVPTLLISPWIDEGTVFRSGETLPNGGELPFDHTSILATLLKWRDIQKSNRDGSITWGLGARTDVAPTFENVLQRSEPRREIPSIPMSSGDIMETREDAAAQPLSDFQRSLFGLVVQHATDGATSWHDPENQRMVRRMTETLKTQGDLAYFAAQLRRKRSAKHSPNTPTNVLPDK